ncbi:hypothetical protein FOH10_29500 [Nocardia otitidiscaviarum]|uniref:Uncharacterized protein n=1 Tax=Nocardia otitidiscaviarum TaxID=1823 RepID=A0A516NTL5_9NOCA|nr:hypothetical protein [Nocardia otitidiscaviarum]MCP9621589.1 hypothetical protein [Nocardia otitidiscaviarum]QDP82255.1 hypothetical protein FOH10_29500 [Nocardia otitidiscaviarum]
MSEMDDITRETSQFTARMAQLLTQLTHATSWLERRRAKKNITQLVREQIREQQQLRALELTRTTQAIDAYRQHSAAVTGRAIAPDTSAEQRSRDHAALVRHYDHLEERILRSQGLTTTEQGIALDGMAAATKFPEYELGDLFGNAHKVKGVDALRYRAQVARAHAATGIERRPAYTRPAERQTTNSTAAPEPDTSGADERSDIARAEAVQNIRHIQGQWSRNAAQLSVEARAQLDAARQAAARRAQAAGLTNEEISREFNTAADNSRIAALLRVTERDGTQRHRLGLHPNEAEAAEWAQRTTHTLTSNHTTGVEVTVTERGQHDPRYTVAGTPGFVADELTTYRDQARRDRDRGPTPPPGATASPPTTNIADQRLSEVERQLTELRTDRDTLARDVAVLRRGLDAVTADRDEQKRQREAAEAEVQALRNTNVRQDAELKNLREKAIQTGVERDKYKTERDEAVRKLAQATPEHKRYGSKARVDAERNQTQPGDTQPMPGPNGHHRNGNGTPRPQRDPIERSR